MYLVHFCNRLFLFFIFELCFYVLWIQVPYQNMNCKIFLPFCLFFSLTLRYWLHLLRHKIFKFWWSSIHLYFLLLLLLLLWYLTNLRLCFFSGFCSSGSYIKGYSFWVNFCVYVVCIWGNQIHSLVCPAVRVICWRQLFPHHVVLVPLLKS